MKTAFLDPYYASTIGPDEDEFMDKSAGKLGVTMGVAKKMIVDGKILVAGGVKGKKEEEPVGEFAPSSYLSNSS